MINGSLTWHLMLQQSNLGFNVGRFFYSRLVNKVIKIITMYLGKQVFQGTPNHLSIQPVERDTKHCNRSM
jgi:hypothetical protein